MALFSRSSKASDNADDRPAHTSPDASVRATSSSAATPADAERKKKSVERSRFSRSDSNEHTDAPSETVIGASVALEGDVKSDGPITVHGTVRGTVVTKDTLIVGSTARVMATVTARSVVVSGNIEGSVTATDRVVLEASGVVGGDVVTKTLVVAEGAQLNGSLNMGGAQGTTRSTSGRPTSGGKSV